MYKLNSVKCGVFVLSFLIGCGSALAKKAQFDESAVSAITLDVLRVEACVDDTDECLIAGGPKQMSLFDLAEGRVDFAKQVLLPDNTTELRLVLGDGSTIAVNGESLPLTVPSGQTSGLKLKGGDVFAAEGGFLAGLALDFDLGRALVVQEKNGKGKGKAADAGLSYSLKPVIQVASAEVAPLTDEVAAVVAMPDEDSEIRLGDKFSLFIPARAVSAPMVISAKETKYTVEVMDEETGEVVEKPALSSNYELNPDGAEFAVPLEITIPYYPETLPSEVSEYDLAVYLDGEKIPTDIDTASKIGSADVWHFSVAGIFSNVITRQDFQTQMPIVDGFQPNNIGWKFMSYADYRDRNGNTYYVYHPAADLNALNDINGNIPVKAIADGEVVANSSGWGGIVIEHSFGDKKYYSQYGHIYHLADESGLKSDESGSWPRVTRGQVIGHIGNIGPSGTPFHLHFEIRRSDSFHPNPTNADFWPRMDKDGDILKTRKEVFKAYESPLAFVRSYQNPYQLTIIVEDSVTYPGIGEDIKNNKVVIDGKVVKERFFKAYPDNLAEFFTPSSKVNGSLGENFGFGGNYHYAPTVSGNETSAGKWFFDIPDAGVYKVYASIPYGSLPPCGSETKPCGATSEKAKYEIYHNDRTDYRIVNQAVLSGSLDKRWASLGTYDFAEGNNHYVKLTNNTGENGKYIGFDAIQLVKVSDAAVTSVLPKSTKVGELTTFTVNGKNLPSSLVFSVDDCADIKRIDVTSTSSVEFRCTPTSPGPKNGIVKFGRYSIILTKFTVNVVDDDDTPEVTSISPSSATLGVATDFNVMGKNLPSTLAFQLEDCTGVEQLDSNTSSTYKQFRCTPSSTGEKKNGTLTDKPDGTVLKNFSVDFIAAPPPSDDEIILAGVRVFDKVEGQILHENGQAEYIAKACLFKHNDVDNLDTPLVDEANTYTKDQCFDDQEKNIKKNIIKDVTDEGSWMVTPGMYADSIDGGLVQAEPDSAGHTVKVSCTYYHSPSNRNLSGSLPVTITK